MSEVWFAVPLVSKELEVDPTNPWAHLSVGISLFALHDAKAAVPHFRAVMASEVLYLDPVVRYRAACCYEDAVRHILEQINICTIAIM